MNNIFVYGTLKKDGSANGLMGRSDATFVKSIRTSSKYKLYDVGSFPGIRESENSSGVVGELYQSSKENCFELLDGYECVSHGLFRRELIELEDGTQANAYLYNRSFDKAKEIENGIWENY